MKPLIFSVFLLSVVYVVFGQLNPKVYKTIGGVTVYEVEAKNVYLFVGGFMIDADGSPKAYHKDNSKALDYLGNAGQPGNWWALATDNKKANGNPLIQAATDPAPGYYISMTSLQDGTKRYEDPNRYVNSETIPYVAIPPAFSPVFVKGDIALVINKKNNKRCYAIFADVGPKTKIGEGSIYLANQLGIKSSPKNGGAASDIAYILIKKSGKGKVLTNAEIQAIGKSKLTPEDITQLLTIQ